jgi:hypothetical protein
VLVDELLRDVSERLSKDEPPEVLWHYTSVAAAQDILRSSSIHLCCHAFMNDPAEGTVAGSIVSESWTGAVNAATAHPRLDLDYIRDMSGALTYFDFSRRELPPTFLFSLTELRDSLSQWSRYGDNGNGVALGFVIRPSELPPESQKPWTTATELIRVDYDLLETGVASRLRPMLARLLPEYLPRFRDPTEIQNALIALIVSVRRTAS